MSMLHPSPDLLAVLRLGCLVSLLPIGCDGSSVIGPIDGDGGNASGDPGANARLLAFVGTAPVISLPSQNTGLRFRLTQGATTTISDAPITFELTGSGGTINATSVNTDSAGIATIHFIAGSAAASLELTASADQANPVTVSIQIQVPDGGDVNVNVTSAARIPVTRAEISLFVTSSIAGAYTCNGLYAAATLPTTTSAYSLTNVPGQHLFSGLPTGSVAAALVYGYTAAGDKVARGCVEKVIVAGGVAAQANVSLTQLSTSMTGSYDVLVTLDLGDALPQPYEGYVTKVTTWLANPAAVVTYYFLAQVDDALPTGFLDLPGTSTRATLEQILGDLGNYSTFSGLSTALDSKLSNDTTVGSSYNAAKTVAADVRTMVSAFDMGSRFAFGTEVGMTGKYPIDEMYEAMVFTWRLGCALGDTGCIRRPIALSETSYSPIHANYQMTVTHAPIAGTTERFKAVAPVHPLPFSYGAVILVGLSEVVFPSVCTTDCTSLGGVMVYLANCPVLGAWLAARVSALTSNFINIDPGDAALYCHDGLDRAAAYIEGEAISLTTVDAAHLESVDPAGGTNGGELFLIDADLNLKPELVRDLKMFVRWVDPTSSIPPPDVTAPVTGKGRFTATDCASDPACAAPESCQLIPSFLEVRRLETTCKKAVGTVAGRASCTASTECRSGTCVRPGGVGVGKCFLACDSSADCGGSTCDPNRTLVSLESTRVGLGNAPGQGCNP
jgi:hypothetical protein